MRDHGQILFDHWLLVEMRGRDPALTGQKLLVVACGLRARLGALLSGALEEAEKRKGTGGGGISSGGAQHDHYQPWPNQDAAADGRRDEQELLQGLPPLLLKARQAWLEGGQLGGGRSDRRRAGEEGGGGGFRERRGRGDEERGSVVDWAQEAEDLSVDLADFMLQSIG